MGPDILQHADFSSEQQAAHLRDLARNGAANEANMYGGYQETSNGQSNGLSGDYTDLDSAALLESLADFNKATSNDMRVPGTNDHFASLLQAAATAGGQEIARANRRKTLETSESPVTPHTMEFFQRSFPPETRSKRKRNQVRDDNDDRDVGLVRTKRRDMPLVPEDPDIVAQQEEIWGPEEEEEEVENSGELAFPFVDRDPIPTADARAAGVHSAAALFRRPTAASKKYTRPPMSKLFLSLGINPEDFLRLQAAAKEYMLDPEHPERIDCVGSKSKGDTDIIKLRLFACVKEFLEDHGWGEKCFSINTGSRERKNKWPEHKNKIISLVTPLMRRMVTNERQRRYAVQTRNEKRKRNPTANSNKTRTGESETLRKESPQQGTSRTLQIEYPNPNPVDPTLDQYHYNPEPSFTSEIRDSLPKEPTLNTEASSVHFNSSSEIRYHVNILQNGHRVKQRYTLDPNSCLGFSSLIHFVHSVMDTSNHRVQDVKILSPSGLVKVKDEDGWRDIITLILGNDWMDGEVKCLIELEDHP